MLIRSDDKPPAVQAFDDSRVMRAPATSRAGRDDSRVLAKVRRRYYQNLNGYFRQASPARAVEYRLWFNNADDPDFDFSNPPNETHSALPFTTTFNAFGDDSDETWFLGLAVFNGFQERIARIGDNNEVRRELRIKSGVIEPQRPPAPFGVIARPRGRGGSISSVVVEAYWQSNYQTSDLHYWSVQYGFGFDPPPNGTGLIPTRQVNAGGTVQRLSWEWELVSPAPINFHVGVQVRRVTPSGLSVYSDQVISIFNFQNLLSVTPYTDEIVAQPRSFGVE